MILVLDLDLYVIEITHLKIIHMLLKFKIYAQKMK